MRKHQFAARERAPRQHGQLRFGTRTAASENGGGIMSGYTLVEQANLMLVRTVYDEVLEPLDPAQVDRYFRADYIQHSPMAETGAEGLKAFLAWAKLVSPDAHHDVKRMFADGDHVIAHVHVVITPGTPGVAVIDIFRIQEGLIAEHWDASQELNGHSANSNGAF
jgi:predicted SnoaL-like aldol condensation-catalyzing enzyme